MPVDPNVAKCPQCGAEFGFFKRRHWCRQCGSTICSGCSVAFEKSLAAFFSKRHPENMCKRCFATKQQQQQQQQQQNNNNNAAAASTSSPSTSPPAAQNPKQPITNSSNQPKNNTSDDISNQILGTRPTSAPVPRSTTTQSNQRTPITSSGGGGVSLGRSLNNPNTLLSGRSPNTSAKAFPTSLLPPSSRNTNQNNNNLSATTMTTGGGNSLLMIPGARSPNPFGGANAIRTTGGGGGGRGGGLQLSRLGGGGGGSTLADGGSSLIASRRALSSATVGGNNMSVMNYQGGASLKGTGGSSLLNAASLSTTTGAIPQNQGNVNRFGVPIASAIGNDNNVTTTTNTSYSSYSMPSSAKQNNNDESYGAASAGAGSLPSNFFAKLSGKYDMLVAENNQQSTSSSSPTQQNQHQQQLVRQSNLSLLQQYILDAHQQITSNTLSHPAHTNKDSSSSSSGVDVDLPKLLTSKLASIDNINLSLHFKGSFKRDHFRACVQVALDRHHAFHSRLELTDVVTNQRTSANSAPHDVFKPKVQRLTVAANGVPLSYHFETCTKNQVAKLIESAIATPFTLSRDVSLFRAHVFEVFEDEEEKKKLHDEQCIRSKNHICCFVSHRLISDNRSLSIFFDDVRALYRHASELIVVDNSQKADSESSSPNKKKKEFMIDENVVQKILPPLFADSFINSLSWDRSLLETTEGQELRHRVMSALPECCTSTIEMPTDHTRGAGYGFQTAFFNLPSNLLTEDDVDRLRQCFSSQSASLTHGILAAFSAVLARYSAQEEVSVAVRQDMRSFCSAVDAVGPFTNFQMFNTKYLALKTLFSEILAGARSFSNDLENRCVPFPALMEKSLPSPAGHFPFSQVSFVSHLGNNMTMSSSASSNASQTVLQLLPIILGGSSSSSSSSSAYHCDMGDVQIRAVPSDVRRTSSMFDLTLHLFEDPSTSHLRIAFEYNTDIFTQSSVSDFAENFSVYLREIAAKGINNIASSYELLSESQKHEMLYKYNEYKYPQFYEIMEKKRGLPFLFEETVAKHPNRLALTMPEGRAENRPKTKEELMKVSRPIIYCRPILTYTELEKLANQFARFLRERFIEPAARMASIKQQQQQISTSSPESVNTLSPSSTSQQPNNSNQTNNTFPQHPSQDINAFTYNQQQGENPFIIAVCMPRCTLQFTAVLAIMKAGAGYLPLDLSYPADRLDFMLGDSNALCVITSRDVADSSFGQLFSTIGTPAVIAEEVTGSLEMLYQEYTNDTNSKEEPKGEVLEYSTEPLRLDIGPRHLTYIIYTSGSTGKPKAVMQNHGALTNLVVWQMNYFPPRPELGQRENGVRTLQFAPISFDISFEETMNTWAVGGALILVSEELRLDPLRLIRLLRAEKVHRLFLPSVSLINVSDMFVETGELPESVTDVIFVAEQLVISNSVVKFFEALRKHHEEFTKIGKEIVTLRDHYGPSETHVISYSVWTGEPSKWPTWPPIGKAIANTQTYVLDDARQLVPKGVVGELYASGENLGSGYLNRKDITDAAFLPCDFPSSGNGKMYKTGDLVRMLPNGDLVYIRRKDFQVKVRGFRVELGEIEAQLAHHPLVQKCVCEVRSKVAPDGSEDKHIVAYVILVADKGDEATAETKDLLQDHLRVNLPPYMVPTVFMFMNVFSLTPSGKVARKLLPVPTTLEFANEVGGPAYKPSSSSVDSQNNNQKKNKKTVVEPQTKTETTVRSIWSDVLGTPAAAISCNASFFQIGGHSLTVAKMLARVTSNFRCEIPVSFAFLHPTITEIAEEIDRIKKQQQDGSGGFAAATAANQLEEFFSMGEGALNQLDDGPSSTSRQRDRQQNMINMSNASLGTRSNDGTNTEPGAAVTLPPHEFRYPLTLNQQSLVYLSTVHPDSAAAYNIIMNGELRGAQVSIEDLTRAFERVLDRFPALRTTFHQDPDSGEFFQTVHASQELDFNVIDLGSSCNGNKNNGGAGVRQHSDMMAMYAGGTQSFSPGSDPQYQQDANNNNTNNNIEPPPQFGDILATDEAVERMRIEGTRPFNLARDSMMRVRLFRATASASSTSAAPRLYLQIVFHHIVTDLWSIVLITEALQEAFSTGSSSTNTSNLTSPTSAKLGGSIGLNSNKFSSSTGSIHNASSSTALPPSTTAPTSAGRTATMIDFARYLQLRERHAAPRMLEQWKKLLRVADRPIPSLDLPTDYPRPTVKTHNGGVRSFSFSPELSEDLRNFAKSNGNTMYSVLLSVVSIVLHKLTRQEEVIVGTPLANRHVQDFENTVGYFINPCPIPVDVSGDTVVTELLQRALNTVHSVMDLQEYPFPQLADRLASTSPAGSSHSGHQHHSSSARSRNASDLFQVMFIYQQPHRLEELNSFFLFQDSAPLTLNSKTGLTMYSVSVPTHMAMYDMVIQFGEGGADNGRVCGCIEYNSDLFHPVMIDSVVSIIEVIVEQILAKPTARVSELRTTSQQAAEWLITETNRHPQHSLVRNNQMMLSFGDVYIDLLSPKQTSFVWLFRKIAARYSNRIAIDFVLTGKERKLTFQELDKLSDALAAMIVQAHHKNNNAKKQHLLPNVSSSNMALSSLPPSPSRTSNTLPSNSSSPKFDATTDSASSAAATGSSIPFSLLNGAFVGVALRRGPLIVVAELAVMKAGGAFIPIDPSYPEDRVRHMLTDSGSSLLICTAEDSTSKFSSLISSMMETQQNLVEQLIVDDVDSITSPALIESVFSSNNNNNNMNEKQICESIVATSHDHLTGDDRCYAIYTSGSTGKPKGVVLGHRGLVNLSYSIRIGYRMQVEQTRFLWFASPSFDASILEIFPILANASTVVILSPDPIVGDSLARLMDSAKITHSVLPPAVLAGIAEDTFPPPSLKILVTAGEAIPGELLMRWRKKVTMLNAYGPTENTVASTVCDYDQLRVFVADRAQNLPQIIHEAQQQDGVIVKAPPIGRTIPNTRCYILDSNLHPCAIGIPGELVVSGPGVAHGYHNLPEKTDQCFLMNPFVLSQQQPQQSMNSGFGHHHHHHVNTNNNNNNQIFSRMYKTGDLVRWSPAFHSNGVIEFSGRIDQQVKIRGYRIELGEVESAILSLPGVSECAVAAKEIPGAGKSLVAYIVVSSASSSLALSSSEMKKKLRASLPEYMVPVVFLTLPKLPLSPSGKIDRNQLPTPSSAATTNDDQNNNGNQNQSTNGESNEESHSNNNQNKELPHTPLQITIATLFAEVLGSSYTSTIGLHDNFFEIGGHSLAAMQLVSRLKEHSGLDIPILKVFDAPTVGALADVIRSAAGDDSSSSSIMINDVSLNGASNEFVDDGIDEEEAALLAAEAEKQKSSQEEAAEKSSTKRTFMLSYNQEALWFSYVQDKASSAFNSTFTAKVSDPSKLNVGALLLAIACCEALHPMLRVKFISHEGTTGVSQTFSKNCFPFLTQRTWIDKQKNNTQEQRKQLEHDAAIPLDLERRSLMVYTYTNEEIPKIPLSPQEQVEKKVFTFSTAPITHFIINFHHIVMDLGSMELVIEQIVKFYSLITSPKMTSSINKSSDDHDQEKTTRETIQQLLSSTSSSASASNDTKKKNLLSITLPNGFPSFVRNNLVRGSLSSPSLVPSVSYIDFAEWQREVLRSSVGEQLAAYWQRHLLGAPAESSFKPDKPRQNPRNLEGGTVVPKLADNFSQAVSEAARSLGTTNATVLLATTFAWLHRITGQNDLIIGTPVGGRTRSELENVVGDFVNILPLRVDIPSVARRSPSAENTSTSASPTTTTSSQPSTSNATFRQVLRSTKTSLLKGLMHQEYPFGLMVEKFCEFRDATKSPLFQVMFVHEKPSTHENAALASFAVGEGGAMFPLDRESGQTIESVELFERQCQFDIVIAISEGEGGQLSMRMQYASSLFYHETAMNLAQQWIAVTTAALSSPSNPVHEISLLTPEQQKKLEERNNKTKKEYDALKKRLTVHEVVEQYTCTKYPDNIAVHDPLMNIELTYKELNGVANALATKLRCVALEKLLAVRHQQNTAPNSEVDLMVYEPSSSLAPTKTDDLVIIPSPVTVAFLFTRSVSTIVSMLAASKSGVSYVPIDTKAPLDRIKYILQDCGAVAVLYHDQSKQLLQSLALCEDDELKGSIKELINVDEFIDQSEKDTKKILQTQQENLSNVLSDENSNNNKIKQHSPLYMIYTSGSTGKPKGVIVHHGGLVSVASWFVEEHKLRPHDVYAQALGAAFDPVNIEVWPSLFSGAKILILDDETKLSDPQSIVDYLHKHRVTHITFPPVLSVKIFQDAVFPKGFAMKSWSCGGEKFSGTKRPLTFSLINAYGPTEASILCAQYPLNFDVPEKALDEPRAPEATRTSVDPPLGDPTANTAHYVLDENDRLCPPGMVGELVVGGPQVAIGYFNNPKTTAKNFVRDPFGVHSTYALRDAEGYPRMYRTGDLVRYDGEFNLHFVGRKDFQVKIRGFRIELGEIETQLLILTDLVSATQVLVYEGPKTNGEKRLFAFVVPAGDRSKFFACSNKNDDNDNENEEITKKKEKQCRQERTQLRKTLHRTLKSRLPDYMIPVFVLVPKFHLTPNGKVDRQKLEVPSADSEEYISAAADGAEGEAVTEPRNEIEKALCELWCDILGVKSVSPLDNWYSRGGSSLTSTVLISRVKQLFDIVITLQQFFVEPTVEGLAKVIAGQGKSTVVDNFAEVLLKDSTALDSSIAGLKTNPELLPFDPQQEPTGIFVTGATGFLGAFLTFELLRETSATIYCLVRAKTESEGLKRILDTFIKYKIAHDVTTHEFESRVVPIVGDLARPYFDLSQQRFNELATLCQCIIHCGAFVNFGYPYSSLKNANVDGTISALRLATTHQLKAVHHISTLSVLPDADPDQTFVSERRLPKEPSKNLYGGYTQSKWVAEQLAWLAFDRGVPVTVHRPGRITGHSTTGATNNDDFLNLFVKGCLEMKCAPLMNMPCELTPVDFCARAIIRCSIRHPTSAVDGHCLHITNQSAMSWEKYFNIMREIAGFSKESVKMVPFKEWREEHLLKLTGASHNALLPLVPTFAADFEKEFEPLDYKTDQLMKDLNDQTMLENLVVSAQNFMMTVHGRDDLRGALPCRVARAEEILQAASDEKLQCRYPETSESLVRVYARYFVQEKFFPSASTD